MKAGRPKELPTPQISGVRGLYNAFMAAMVSRATLTSVFAGGGRTRAHGSTREDHGPGKKLARRIRALNRA